MKAAWGELTRRKTGLVLELADGATTLIGNAFPDLYFDGDVGAGEYAASAAGGDLRGGLGAGEELWAGGLA